METDMGRRLGVYPNLGKPASATQADGTRRRIEACGVDEAWKRGRRGGPGRLEESVRLSSVVCFGTKVLSGTRGDRFAVRRAGNMAGHDDAPAPTTVHHYPRRRLSI